MPKKSQAQPKARTTIASLEARLFVVEQSVSSMTIGSSEQAQDKSSVAMILSTVALVIAVLSSFPAMKSVVDGFRGGGKSDHEQKQVEPDIKPKKLSGALVAVHNRLPMSMNDQKLVNEALEYERNNPGLDFESIDVADNDERVAAIIKRAAEVGINPPFFMHKSIDGKLKFCAWLPTWESVVKELGR